MKPSFLSLYKRGRYLSTPDIGDDSEAAKTQRKETERFVVAALAFCLRHDEGFRKHFWEKVCRVPDDKEMPLITADDIAIEPPRWADLSLASHNSRFKWVIEVKAGAPLKPKQDPTKSKFKVKGVGYGALFRDAEAKRRTQMRYIVLGANKCLGIREGKKELGISVQERSWDHLLEQVEEVEGKGIVRDLIDTFAELRIREFYMKKARTIVMTPGGIQDAVKAATVLDAIGKYLDIPEGKRRLQADSSAGGTDWYGYYVEQPRKRVSGNYLKLRSATRKSGELAWFGYGYDAAGKGNKAVWFWLDDEPKRDSLKRKLISNGFTAEPGQDDDNSYWVSVSPRPKQSGKDLEWFQKVVDCAIGK